MYSSTLERAYRTAEIVAEPHGLEVESSDAFKEQDAGEFEDEHWDEREKALEQSDKEYHEHRPENGENLFDLKERALSGLEKMKNEHRGETVILLGHGHMNRVLMMAALGYGPDHAVKIDQDNCCVNELEWSDTWGWLLRRVNDTCHLG